MITFVVIDDVEKLIGNLLLEIKPNAGDIPIKLVHSKVFSRSQDLSSGGEMKSNPDQQR